MRVLKLWWYPCYRITRRRFGRWSFSSNKLHEKSFKNRKLISSLPRLSDDQSQHMHLSFQSLKDKQIYVVYGLKKLLFLMMCELRWKSPFYLNWTRTSSTSKAITLKKYFIIVWTNRILTHSWAMLSLFITCKSI